MSELLKYEDTKALDAKTIDAKVSEYRRKIFEMNMQRGTTGMEKPHLKKVYKKNIAKLLTAKSLNK